MADNYFLSSVSVCVCVCARVCLYINIYLCACNWLISCSLRDHLMHYLHNVNAG